MRSLVDASFRLPGLLDTIVYTAARNLIFKPAAIFGSADPVAAATEAYTTTIWGVSGGILSMDQSPCY